MQESENQRERGEGNDIQPATVGINVPVRPETPSGSAVVPVVTGNEEHVSTQYGCYMFTHDLHSVSKKEYINTL